MYQQHLDKPIPVRRRWHWRITWRIAPSGSNMMNYHWQPGKRSSRRADLPGIYRSWIEKEIDDLADRPGAGFAVVKRTNAFCMKCARGGAVRPSGSLLRHVYR